MATLVLTAVGTALGGPLGGTLGALVGRSIDGAIFGTPGREGPRLKDLAVTTSSYGTAIARHFGQVRAAGSVIWSTELKEDKQKSGGGKGKPKTTTYSYSVSFAVALASRQIAGLGRIWADGNLLRGTSGDLKAGGKLRVYDGREDQAPDSLIAADVGTTSAPAFRGVAYCVFENLQLADFGNRIPALTFEIIADDGSVSLQSMFGDDVETVADAPLADLDGFSHEAGNYAAVLETIDTLYPVACDGIGTQLRIADRTASAASVVIDLPAPAIGEARDFAAQTGIARQREAAIGPDQVALRYYDVARDYQPGLQRSRGKPGNGQVETIEFPASLTADTARRLSDHAAARRDSARESIAYRIAELDPDIGPGRFVRPFGERGLWQVREWEWRGTGIELQLEAISPALSAGLVASGYSGEVQPPVDSDGGPTRLAAFELPWDGVGNNEAVAIYAAASSSAAGWTGAALYADPGDGSLIPAGTAGRERAIIGATIGALPAGSPHIFDRTSELIVQLVATDLAIASASIDALSQGANRALVGKEIIQFANATAIGQGQWRLSGLLRGRGGTEPEVDSHLAGEDFVLLDELITPLDPGIVNNPPAQSIVALGNNDPDPVITTMVNAGASLRPLSPVHGSIALLADGAMVLAWTRRARGAWLWLDAVEVPLNEPTEDYEVTFIDAQGTRTVWRVTTASLTLSAAQTSTLAAAPVPSRFEVRQVGRASLSSPLSLPFPL